MRQFDKNIVKPGDKLFLARDPSLELRFKFMYHGGDVVATWVVRPPGRPLDAILRQKDVLMDDEPIEFMGWGVC